MRRSWKYQGRNVAVSQTADIPSQYRPGNSRDWVVQRALDILDSWKEGEDPIHTIDVGSLMPSLVVPIKGRQVRWLLHRGHHARQVKPSPFVQPREPVMVRRFTIELVGKPQTPHLVRAYPGDYIPPLPWQKSASWADGGREACVEFWRKHAYVYRPTLVVNEQSQLAPSWFTH